MAILCPRLYIYFESRMVAEHAYTLLYILCDPNLRFYKIPLLEPL